MSDHHLSAPQLTVISALSTGATLTAAAHEAGVHRNTINNWRRTSTPFQHALVEAQYDRALYYREKIEAEIDLAIQTLHALLTDPKTPASVRLKAALTIIQTAATPPQPSPQIAAPRYKNAQDPIEPQAPNPSPAHNDLALNTQMHKTAQSPTPKICDNARPFAARDNPTRTGPNAPA
ncbi:MAG TPA: hypothetical protein VGL72_20490 [Bryobacteraceae bacterium]|jgi:hypothetical protein